MNTRKQFYFLAIITILFTGFLSCSDDDNDDHFKSTNIAGRPSRLNISNATTEHSDTYFYYDRDLLSKKISKPDGGLTTRTIFNYKDGSLGSVSSAIEDKDVQDGSSIVRFIQSKDNKNITVEVSAEPLFQISKFEIELDDNKLPSKITIYHHTDGAVTYATFEYDPTSKNLLKQTIYDIKSGEIKETRAYEYDNNVGVMSKTNLPIWYYVYKVFSERNSTVSRLNLNYANNVIKETSNEGNYEYEYEYNTSKAPISMTTTLSKILITY